jgi:hypothetical protein
LESEAETDLLRTQSCPVEGQVYTALQEGTSGMGLKSFKTMYTLFDSTTPLHGMCTILYRQGYSVELFIIVKRIGNKFGVQNFQQ